MACEYRTFTLESRCRRPYATPTENYDLFMFSLSLHFITPFNLYLFRLGQPWSLNFVFKCSTETENVQKRRNEKINKERINRNMHHCCCCFCTEHCVSIAYANAFTRPHYLHVNFSLLSSFMPLFAAQINGRRERIVQFLNSVYLCTYALDSLNKIWKAKCMFPLKCCCCSFLFCFRSLDDCSYTL